jgi:hypothetical protein
VFQDHALMMSAAFARAVAFADRVADGGNPLAQFVIGQYLVGVPVSSSSAKW